MQADDAQKRRTVHQRTCLIRVCAKTQVLEKDGGNVKALYRRAQARLALGEFVEAETDLKRALLEEPGNTGVRTLYKEYKQKVQLAGSITIAAL